MTAHIFLNGLVGAPTDFMSFDPFFTPEDVQRHIDENKNASTLVVHITSNGGFVDDAFAIHDKLTNSGKKIHTIGEGYVKSAGTIIFMAGTKRKLMKYADFMIHNPFGTIRGNAEELQRAASDMQRVQDKIANLYSDTTGKDVKQFEKWMDEERTMSADEALEIGFITEVLEPMKAVAHVTNNNSQNQNSTIMNFIAEMKSEWVSLKNQIMGTPKNLDLTLADGRTFKVDTDKGEPEVGNTVSVDGKSATDGDHIIPAMNKTIVVTGGKISAINETSDPGDEDKSVAAGNDTSDVKALKDQLAAKDLQISALTGKVSEQEKAMAEVITDIKMLKSNVASNYVPKDRTQNFSRKSADDGQPKNAVAEAAEERKRAREAANKK
jgi:ATP-dependent Clp protease protease subunit